MNEQVAGVFSQSGGTHTVANSLTLNPGGTYTLGGSALQLPGIQGGGAFSFSGGTLVAAPGFTTDQTTMIALSGNGGYVNTNSGVASFAGALSGSGGLNVFGGGTLNLATSNSFTGGTTVFGNGTTILLSDPNAMQGSTLTLTANNVGLTFDTGGGENTSFNLGGLSGTGNASLADADGNPLAVVVGGNGASTIYNGVLSGSGGSLTKAGNGTLVLGAANTYTDATSVNGGALLLDFTQSGVPTTNIVANTSTLSLGGGTLAIQGKASANNSQNVHQPGDQSRRIGHRRDGGRVRQGRRQCGKHQPRARRHRRFHTARRHAVRHERHHHYQHDDQRHPRRLRNLRRHRLGHRQCRRRHRSSSQLYRRQPRRGAEHRHGERLALRHTGAITSALTINSLLLTGNLGVNMSDAGSLTLASGGLIGNTSGSITGGVLEGAPADFSDGELIVFTPQTLTIASVIADNSGPTDLTKSGSGTLVLTGSNTYSGVTTINAGTLQLGSVAAVANLSTVNDNAVLAFNLPSPATFSGTIGGPGSLVQAGPSVLTLLAANFYTGSTVISAGTLQIGNGGSGAAIAGSSLLNNGSLIFNHDDSLEYDGVISGSGGLTQTGGGLLILTANNTYNGNTTISSGTVQLGNGTPSGSLGTGAITDNDTLVFNRSDNPTFSGLIGGSGVVVQIGGDLVVLTGTNNAAGGTVISAGTVQVGSGVASGSLGTGPVNIGDTLVFNMTGSATAANVISGNGNLLQTGAGAVTLLGNNSFQGDVTISAGTLQVGNGGSGASLAHANSVEDDGSLIFNHSDNVLFDAVISGSGSLTQAGNGILVLTNDNTYGGGTIISGGTLQVGHGGSGAAISAAAAVLDNGTLVFSHNDSLEIDGAISGSGSLTQSGIGTLILAGSNTYSGTTTISGGAIQLGNGGAGEFLASPSVILATTAAALVFSQSDSMIYSGAISGAGNLTQAGPGIVTLTGSNTYSGSTTISSGTLQVGTGGGGSLGSGPVLDYGSLVYNLAGPLTYPAL